MNGMLTGPVCAYWSEEDAPICGHSSCYSITEEGGDPGYDIPDGNNPQTGIAYSE